MEGHLSYKQLTQVRFLQLRLAGEWNGIPFQPHTLKIAGSVSAPLRSAQNRGPLDLVRPVSHLHTTGEYNLAQTSRPSFGTALACASASVQKDYSGRCIRYDTPSDQIVTSLFEFWDNEATPIFCIIILVQLYASPSWAKVHLQE